MELLTSYGISSLSCNNQKNFISIKSFSARVESSVEVKIEGMEPLVTEFDCRNASKLSALFGAFGLSRVWRKFQSGKCFKKVLLTSVNRSIESLMEKNLSSYLVECWVWIWSHFKNNWIFWKIGTIKILMQSSKKFYFQTNPPLQAWIT